ncbi:MAG: hypothetical protein ACLFU1_02045 [Alphaproteobacteria bacterium]
MANSPHNQDTITVPQTGTMLVNFRHISDPTIKNPYIDWNKNDALTQTVESLIQQTTADVKDHFAAQERSGTGMDLLATHHWSGAQKVEWEEALAKIVSENVEETPGFSEYREAGFHSGRITLGDGTLNAVSIDLTSSEADTYGQKLNMIQFSDKEMAIVEGVIFNHVQNSLLPKEPQEPGNEKVASNYFLVSGQTLSNEKSQISFLGESLPPAAQRSLTRRGRNAL